MPRPNRVDPFGNITPVPNRGLFMGNRGCIHTLDRQLARKRWARKAWVTCLLEHKGRHRQIMAPGRYTELFFLDEATALAAGHRPCATCRRHDYERFKRLWVQANGGRIGIENPSIGEIDNQLHEERVTAIGDKNTWQAQLGEVPDGVMVTLNVSSVWLVLGDELLEWSPGGYVGRTPRRSGAVSVLTPSSTVRAIASGYSPMLHPTAGH